MGNWSYITPLKDGLINGSLGQQVETKQAKTWPHRGQETDGLGNAFGRADMEELHHYLGTTKRCKERIGRSCKKTYDILNVYFKNWGVVNIVEKSLFIHIVETSMLKPSLWDETVLKRSGLNQLKIVGFNMILC